MGQWRQRLPLGLIAIAAAIAVVASGEQSPWFSIPPATAQLVRYQEAGERLYQRLPDFPLANQYISQRTGKVVPSNTLASRLIYYHVYLKGRSPIYRLDWKITLADYLGLNDYIVRSDYPGSDLLKTNPLEGDRAVINQLSRSQRNALVQALVEVHTVPELDAPGADLHSPQPGDARLLSP